VVDLKGLGDRLDAGGGVGATAADGLDATEHAVTEVELGQHAVGLERVADGGGTRRVDLDLLEAEGGQAGVDLQGLGNGSDARGSEGIERPVKIELA